MIDLLALAVGVGLAIGLLFSEVFGLMVGGIILGHIALNLTQPLVITSILATGLAAFLIVRFLSSVLIVVGRRRTALMVLVALLLSVLVRPVLAAFQGPSLFGTTYQVIGYVIPGLIAVAIDKRGIIETFSTALTAAVVVRLVLILLVPSLITP